MMRKRLAKGAVSLGAVLVMGACGGGGAGEEGATTGGGATTLSMIDNAFEPASLTVAAGSEIQLSNDGQAPHNLTIEGTDIDEDLEAGQSTNVAIDAEPGQYTMFCEYHRDAGMEGTVTIE